MSNHSQTVSVVNVETRIYKMSVEFYLNYTLRAFGNQRTSEQILCRHIPSHSGHNQFTIMCCPDTKTIKPPEEVYFVTTVVHTSKGWEPGIGELFKEMADVLEQKQLKD